MKCSNSGFSLAFHPFPLLLSDAKARKPPTWSWPQGGRLVSRALRRAILHWREGVLPQSVHQLAPFCLCSWSSQTSHLGFQAPGFNILSFSRGPWETLAESQALCPAPGSGISSFLTPCGLQVAQGRLHRPATVTMSAVSSLPLWEGRCSGGPPTPTAPGFPASGQLSLQFHLSKPVWAFPAPPHFPISVPN